MATWPRITVVTPSFNQAAYLPETIEAVLGQHYANLEYFIIDGGSTDGSVDIIRRYEKHLAGWVSEKDAGQADAINKGFAKATGEIFAYINSDDVYAPGAFEAAVALFAAGHQWVAGGVRDFGEGRPDAFYRYLPEETPEGWAIWFVENPIHQPGTFWGRELWERFGPFDVSFRYVFDYDFFMKLRILGDIRPVPGGRVFTNFRIHPSSKTGSEREKFEPEFERVRARMLEARPDLRRTVTRYRARQTAYRLQIQALQHTAEGRRSKAFNEWLKSIRTFPPVIGERRTAGCIKRIILGRTEGVA